MGVVLILTLTGHIRVSVAVNETKVENNLKNFQQQHESLNATHLQIEVYASCDCSKYDPSAFQGTKEFNCQELLEPIAFEIVKCNYHHTNDTVTIDDYAANGLSFSPQVLCDFESKP